ncbi:MAG: amino acid adenylation domain-containing protein [Nocardiaceae bacterium]|nr:amino acid adenylation domain-containing protein [Nocardiaceae bacterium]
MYRTGDLVRWLPGGEVEYIGRTDFQVKLRGLRIELGEIESSLAAIEGVEQAAVVVRHDDRTGDQLVAYVVGLEDTDLLKNELARSLPPYMVPAAWVFLSEFPLNASGKLDRKALPAPTFEAGEYRAPSTPIEETVAGVFAELLGIDRVGADADFFALGGNSLVATQVVASLGAALNTFIPVRAIFEASTVSALAAKVEQHRGKGARKALVAGARPDRVPLSLAQHRMWFLNRFEPESAINNIPIALRLTGALDVSALQDAFRDVLTRHDVLRTVYPESAQGPSQVVLPVSEVPSELPILDVAESELIAAATKILTSGFDVTQQISIRGALLRVSDADHVLVIVVHHISADGFSMGPLARDVMVAYGSRIRGDSPSWTPLPVQYADFALWQREVLGEESDPESLISAQVDYWRERLNGLPALLDLPRDRARPMSLSYRGANHWFSIPEDTARQVVTVAKAAGVTPFMVVHSALAVLLARLSGTSDIAIGTPSAGRGEAVLDDVVGMFVNTLVLRTEVDPNATFGDLLEQVRSTDLDAFGNADLPFERLVEILNPVRSTAHTPLFQVALQFQNLGLRNLELPDLKVSTIEADMGLAKFDLQFSFYEKFDAAGALNGFDVEINYATDLFDELTVARFGDRLLRIFAAAKPAQRVGDIDLLSDVERTQIVEVWNQTEHASESADTLLNHAFERQALITPDAVAVEFEGEFLTYAEFSARVNRLARYLKSIGVGPETRVALGMRRSLDLVVGMYSIVTAGGAWVPVDPDHPAERIQYILEAAEPVCVLATTSELQTTVPVVRVDELDLSDLSSEPVPATARPENTAYVIFTSGSTGRPKGVAVPHAAIVNQIEWMNAEYGLTGGDVYLQKTATTFDVSLWGYWMPLAAGARLIVATPDGHRDAAYVSAAIARHGVTITDFVPSMLSVFISQANAEDLASLRHVFVIGEALPGATATAWMNISPAGLHNLYGPTEAAVSVSHEQAKPEHEITVPIGVPEWNVQWYALDSRLQPVPVGVPGELYLAGVQLARGYLGRPDLTADRFVANPFGVGRMYRTGDLVRFLANGSIDYIGRTDFQVKFRGQRIELGEIETVLLRHAAISQSVVIVRDSEIGQQLVAYVVAEADLDMTALREHCAKELPRYMVPEAFVVMEAFPLNTSGKLDRKALPAPVFAARDFRAPSTPVEEIVAGVFAEALGLGRVGADDDFFALGGNSLLATQVIAALNDALGTTIPVRMLFEAPIVSALAAKSESQSTVPLVAGPRPERIPLSLAQQRMWFLNRFDPESPVYNLPVAIRLSGALDDNAMRLAVKDVVGRHEVLRTIYPEIDGVAVQVVLAAATPRLDVEAVADDELVAKAVEFVNTGFDVTADVPLRVRLYQLSDIEHVLVFVVHHIAGDGSSMAPLARDVMVAYSARVAGESPTWAPLPVQYADFALWQRAVLGAEEDPESLAAKQIRYWSEALAGVPEVLDLPRDRPRPALASYRGALHRFEVDETVTAGLTELARQRGATTFMVVHSALAVLLSRLSGSNDVAIGTPVAGRGDAALAGLIGMFVNTLVLRSEIEPGETFADLLTRTRAHDLAAFSNGDVPFERLVEILKPVRSQAHSPMFQVLLAFQNFGQTTFELPNLTISGVDFDAKIAKFDLQFTFSELYREDGSLERFAVEVNYATDLFDATTVARFGEQLARILSAIVADGDVVVGDIELTDAVERTQVLKEWNDTAHNVPADATLATLFQQAVAKSPNAIALVEGDGPARVVLTYAQFSARVNRLARWLVGEGVGPESMVGVGLYRSVDMVVAMYAIHAAGGAYVPLDPNLPLDRLQYIVEAARPVVVLTGAEEDLDFAGTRSIDMRALGLDGYSDAPLTDADRRQPHRPDNVAYVVFTSGSTGRPKGVAISQYSAVNQVLWEVGEYGINADDVVLQKTPATFDVSVWELFATILAGGTLVVAKADGHGDPAYLANVIESEKVTMTSFVPSMLDVFAGAVSRDSIASLRLLQIAGEALTGRTLAALAKVSDATTYNLYGPTEFTVHAVTGKVEPIGTAAVPIGVPVWNAQALILDSRLRPVPIGVAGELYLGGRQVARAYYGRADLTAERFVANPYAAGERMYRTGDLVRWNRDGKIEYIGRTDFQVKLRGLRIELGEIEAVLLEQPEVAQACAMVRKDGPTGDVLTGYVVAQARHAIDTAALARQLGERVPAYMVPTAWVVLDEFPLNVSGKLDRKQLPAPTFEAKSYRAPSTPVEELVAGLFADLLGVGRVGVDDDFFALGGNSLIATQVVARLSAALDARIAVRVLFEASTVAALSARVESHRGEGSRRELTAAPRPDVVPLSLAQQRMWFLNQFDPGSAAYNIPIAIQLTGALDVAALKKAIIDLVSRHEVLRTIYPEVDGAPVQQILPISKSEIELTTARVSADEVYKQAEVVISKGFDVTTNVPIRAALFEIVDAPQPEHVIVVVVHHIAGDGFSMGPLARDVMTAYAIRRQAGEPAWAPLAVQYADFALWQRDVLGSEDDPDSLLNAQQNYWTTQLAGIPDLLPLPLDRPRPSSMSNRGGTVKFEIDESLRVALTELGQRHNATLFMVIHAAYAVLLSRLSGTDDIVIGTPISGRGESALDDLVGMFVNTLALRSHVAPELTFTDILIAARRTDLEAFENSEVPFERLVDALAPVRSQAHTPVFQVSFAFQNLGVTRFELPDLTVAPLEFDAGIAKFDLALTIGESITDQGAPAGLVAEFTYATDILDEASIRGASERFIRILQAVVVEPEGPVGDIEILSDSEIADLSTRAGTAIPDPVRYVDVIAESVTMNPDAVAVVARGHELSYRELDEWSNRAARVLIRGGVRTEQVVAVSIGRSIESVVAVWAVLKSGGVFLPVDPKYPTDRQEFMLSDSRTRIGLTTAEWRAGLPDDVQWLAIEELRDADVSSAAVTDDERLAPVRVDNLAWMMYTSGSTGRPKSVAVTNAGIAGLMEHQRRTYRATAQSRIMHFSSPSFDASVFEHLLTFGAGATLVVVPPDVVGGADLAALMAENRVTHAVVTPGLFATVDPTGLDDLQVVVAAGEAIPADLVARWSKTDAGRSRQFFDAYGPTEATCICTAGEIATGVPVTIGEPISGARIAILDSRLRVVPVGVAGELYVSTRQLARGYHGRADLSASRFVADPYGVPGERMYRTGDVVRWTAKGEIEFVGRSDFQVKIRGFRVELGEIDAVLSDHPDVRSAVTVVFDRPPTTKVLTSYVIPMPGVSIDMDALRDHVAERVPAHMVPTWIVVLDEFPMTPVGKLDRKALPAPVVEAQTYRAPTTPIEQIVANAFAEVLGLEQVGADDDFFALGGNSLLATNVVARIGAAIESKIPVRLLFEASTVAELAVRAETDAEAGPRVPLVARVRPASVPLSLAQQRIWVINQIDVTSPAYNIPLALRLTGDLDIDALRGAFNDVLGRHEILRTAYPEVDGQPVQQVRPVADIADCLDVIVDSDVDPVTTVMEMLSRGFDVAVAPPLRALVVKAGPQDYVFALVIHHISADGSSMAPLARDVVTAYLSRVQGQPPAWAPLPVQYADFTLWQHEVVGSDSEPGTIAARQMDYWRTALDGLADELGLPADRPRPSAPSMRGAVVKHAVSAEIHRRLVEFAQQRHATLFMIIHAAYAVMLARVAGVRDVAIGTPIASRGEAELDDLVGMFVNTLVLRTDVDLNLSFADLVTHAREVDLAAFANADVPFERIAEVLRPGRRSSFNPLFQVMLQFQNVDRARVELPGLTVEPLDGGDYFDAKVDLTLVLEESYGPDGSPQGLTAMFGYATDLFDEATVRTFAEIFDKILAAVSSDANAVIGDIEIRSVIAAPTAMTQPTTPALVQTAGTGLAQAFAAVVEDDPDAPAVVFGDDEFSYRELDERSSRLARRLIELGQGPGDHVALSIDRSRDFVIAAWAVIKAGAAIVPINGDVPDSVRVGISASKRDGAVEWVVVDDPILDTLSARPVTYINRVRPLAGDNPAGVVDGSEITFDQLAAMTAMVRADGELNYESRTFAAGGGAPALVEVIAAGLAGGAVVAIEPDIEESIEETLVAEWVTHLFGRSAEIASIDFSALPDVDSVVVVGARVAPDNLRESSGTSIVTIDLAPAPSPD